MRIRKEIRPEKLVEERDRLRARKQIDANKPISKKKLIFRISLSLILIAVGVIAVISGLHQDAALEEGLQSIKAEQDESVPFFQVGVELQYWLSGSVSQNRITVRELSSIFSDALKSAYIQLDPVKTYDSWTNLASINQNQGSELVVSKELYKALADALERTNRGEGYSLFNGALYAEWEALRYLFDPIASDPTVDADQAKRLSRLAAATADLSNFSLELLDPETCKVRFTVSQSYRDLLAELEIPDAPILDFNTLREAWKLQLVSERLEAQGYSGGYLVSRDGIILALSGYEGGSDFCMYGQLGGESVPAAARSILAKTCTVQLRAFGFPEEEGYYAMEAAGQTLLRHPWLSADGDFRESVLTAMVSGEGFTAPEICYTALRLLNCDSDAAAKSFASGLSASAALLLRSEPETVFYTDESVYIFTEFGYTGKKIS